MTIASCREYDCPSCGRHIVEFPDSPLPEMCGHCRLLPHWWENPDLARIIDPEGDRQIPSVRQ